LESSYVSHGQIVTSEFCQNQIKINWNMFKLLSIQKHIIKIIYIIILLKIISLKIKKVIVSLLHKTLQCQYFLY